MTTLSSPYTVLVVDDQPDNIALLVDVLTRASFQVLVAEDGEAALVAAARRVPDVVLLDVMMPGLDGWKTFERLRADERTRGIPVLYMTSLADTADRVRAYAAGAVDYVTKPFRAEEVLARVTAHARGRRLAQALDDAEARLAQARAVVDERLRPALGKDAGPAAKAAVDELVAVLANGAAS